MELDNETNADLHIWLTYKVMKIRLCEPKDNINPCLKGKIFITAGQAKRDLR
ncbi:MAG: hypothetical protein LBM07_00685 [Culturomica sp.]|nr:hypothetical protein [Culturomica sp.]